MACECVCGGGGIVDVQQPVQAAHTLCRQADSSFPGAPFVVLVVGIALESKQPVRCASSVAGWQWQCA